MSIIKLSNIEKYYNKGKESEVHALKKTTLEIEKGEMVALMGVSGSGKSTLLHILGLIDQYDTGEYLFNGQDVSKINRKQLAAFRNEAVGFVMQNFGLVLYQTVFQNVSLPLLLNPKMKYADIKPKVHMLLEELGILEKANIPVDLLSGGQQQRVAIARAIANEPLLLIADEPTGALDSQTAQDVLKIFRRLNQEKNMTVIIATHDHRVAEACSRTITVSDGMIFHS